MKGVIAVVLLLCCGFVVAGATDEAYFTAYVDSGAAGGFVVKAGKDPAGACFGFFADEISATGWARLGLTSNGALADSVQMEACGFLEGFFTAERVWQSKVNFWSEDFADFGGTPPEKLYAWFAQHRAWLDAQNATDPMFVQARLLHTQLKGMAAAIALHGKPEHPVSFEDLCILNADGDSGDILDSLGLARHTPYSQMSGAELWQSLAKRGRCSAIVRAAPDLSEVWVSHTTWGSYPTMLRVSRAYHFPLHGVASRGTFFVGYFGLVASDDDFYATEDTRLAVTETTNDIVNDELFKLVTPKSLLYWERVMAANRLAVDGKSWTELFATAQSGTYSNQWIIFDSSRFVAGKQLLPGALWIYESCPGHTHAEDMTGYLRTSGTWPSFNRPFFADMFELLGYEAATRKYGPLFSYDAYTRANIFRRDAGSIASLEDLKSFIRSNSWKTDPFSYGYPGNAISARFDLKGGPSPGSPWDSWWKLGVHGGSDAKIIEATKLQKASTLEIVAISGPPVNEHCPVFEWTGQWANVTHLGHPDRFNFGWLRLTSDV